MSLIFDKILPFILYYFEKHILYRLKRSWGIANLRKIKLKGENVIVMGYTRFLGSENINLGNNVRIGYGCFLYGRGGISIGDNTILSRNVVIYSSNHNYKGTMVPYDDTYINKSVVIGTGVWIGMNVMITPGVKIGDGAIIGMGSVISKDVQEGAIVVGSSQRVVSTRDMSEFYEYIDKDLIFSKRFPNR